MHAPNLDDSGDSYSSTLMSENFNWIHYLGDSLELRDEACRSNYARPGHSAEDDLPAQLTAYLTDVKSDGNKTPDNTLFILWIGINDCCRSNTDELEDIIDGMFEGIYELYNKASARHFLIVDLPPIERSPQAIRMSESYEFKECVGEWNAYLLVAAEQFISSTKHASVFVASSYNMLNDILNNPDGHGFSQDDVSKETGAIWVDDLHLTTAVHAILAKRIKTALGSFPVSTTKKMA